jgi:hypothetical protein
MLYFCKDTLKVKAFDENTSIVTIKVSNGIVTEFTELLDHLCHASKWLKVHIASERASLMARGVYVP